MYSNDPIYPEFRPVKPVRLWPWVLSGLIIAGSLWLYLTPIPARPTIDPIITGIDSPLYGQIRGVKP